MTWRYSFRARWSRRWREQAWDRQSGARRGPILQQGGAPGPAICNQRLIRKSLDTASAANSAANARLIVEGQPVRESLFIFKTTSRLRLFSGAVMPQARSRTPSRIRSGLHRSKLLRFANQAECPRHLRGAKRRSNPKEARRRDSSLSDHPGGSRVGLPKAKCMGLAAELGNGGEPFRFLAPSLIWTPIRLP